MAENGEGRTIQSSRYASWDERLPHERGSWKWEPGRAPKELV